MPGAPFTLPPWTALAVSALATAGVLGVLWRADVIRPTSFPPARRRDVFGIPAPVWFVGGAVIFLAQPLAGQMILALVPGARSAHPDARSLTLVQVVAYSASLVAASVVLYLFAPRTNEKTGLRLRLSDVPRGVLAFLGVAPACVLVNLLSQRVAETLSGRPQDRIGHSTLGLITDPSAGPWRWALAAAACLGAPVVEELIYRVMLQSSLLALTGRTWPAVLITAGIFTAVHASVAALPALPTLLVLSLGMGIAYERTRRMGVPITVHVLFNVANVMLAVLTRE